MATIRLPTFHDPALRSLMACGDIATEDKGLLKWMEEQPLIITRYKTPEGTYFMRVILGGSHPNHYHVDVVVEDVFQGTPPKPTHKLTEARKAMDRVAGMESDTLFSGRFRVATSELPPIIRSTIVQSVEGDVAIKTVGGKLAVSGAPIHLIEWGIRERSDSAFVDLDARKKTTISETYLTGAVDLVDSAFGVFVVRKDRHAPARSTGR
jgi:hypothetical protein